METKWVLTTERNPEENGEYLVTVFDKVKFKTKLSIAKYNNGWDKMMIIAWADKLEPYSGNFDMSSLLFVREERIKRVVNYRLEGKSFQAIGDAVGVALSTARGDLQAYLDENRPHKCIDCHHAKKCYYRADLRTCEKFSIEVFPRSQSCDYYEPQTAMDDLI